MNKRLLKKLNSRRGASIIFALLLMLVVIMVSVVVVTAAKTSARTLKMDKEAQQAYLTISSAAQLLRDSVCEDANQFTIVTLEEMSADETWSQKSQVMNDPEPSGDFSNYINEGLTFLLKPANKGKVYEASFTMENDQLGVVGVDWSMSATSLDGGNTTYVYKIVADLSLEGTSVADSYNMQMMVEAQIGNPKILKNGSIRTTTIKYTWNSLNATIE